VWPGIIVIVLPRVQGSSDLGERGELRFVQQLVAQAGVELSMTAFWVGLQGAIWCDSIRISWLPGNTAMLVSSVLLSETQTALGDYDIELATGLKTILSFSPRSSDTIRSMEVPLLERCYRVQGDRSCSELISIMINMTNYRTGFAA